jgi:hypothetical protein
MLATTRRWGPALLGIVLFPTVAFALESAVFQLRDNQHEPTVGFFMTVGVLLSVWGASGYLAARGARRPASAAKSGAAAALVSVALLAAAFIILNNLFVDRMSNEPDRIRAFQQSGYATMRAYINHELVLSSFFPVLGAVAVVVGAIGGVVGAARHP